jgi:polysaccharide deacetylase family protein (PEP-CTERM system associated)
MSILTLFAIPLAISPVHAQDLHDATRADCLLLAVIGIAFLLLSTLTREFGRIRNPEDLPPEEIPSPATQRVELVSLPMPAEIAPVAARPLLSVDVEDYFQTEAMSRAYPREAWDNNPLRVVNNTQRLLDLFDEFGAKATFFTMGWVADRAPALVREIAERGHELACHSYWHRTVYSLRPEEFRHDTRQAVAAIEDAAGVHVDGYRAPTWSITRQSLWAIRILAEEGFSYDSSIYPIRHDLYGIPGAVPSPHIWKFEDREILEIPPATFSIGQSRLPAAGGGYLRIFPLRFSCMAIDQLTHAHALPVVYMHPWEIDPEQPRAQVPMKSRIRQYWGLSSFEGKLRRLLAQYQFVPFRSRYVEVGSAAPRIHLQDVPMAVAS